MVRPTLDDLPDLPLPDGFEIRPIDTALARQVWHADIEAFEDHWGGFDHSEERLQRWLDAPATDLSLWVVAFDGDEVAGGSSTRSMPTRTRRWASSAAGSTASSRAAGGAVEASPAR